MKKNRTAKSPAATSTRLKEWHKDALCIALLYVLVLFLFQPYVLQNKVFTTGGDVSAAIAIQKAAQDLIKEEGTHPLWFPYMFSGMPNFASGMYADPSNIPVIKFLPYLNPFTYINWAANLLFLNRDNAWEFATFFFAGLFMFVLARQLGFSRWIALVAAISFMFCNFFVASMAAGHGGKVKSIAYIALVFLTVYRFFRERTILNWSIMGFVMGVFFVDPGHTQILYYTFLMLGIYLVFHATEQWKTNRPSIVWCALGLGGAILAGTAFGAFNYFSLYVYSDVTMRAVPPALAQATEMAGNSGMTFDYITMWSFHPLEFITFFIPSFFGLESPYYWGWMTFTSSAFYFGLVPVLAAIVGLIYRRNAMTWFLATTALVALLISFGRFFEPFFKLMLAVLPFFSKFRVPSMILSVFAFAVCLLACYGLDYLFNPTEEEKKNRSSIQKVVLYSLMALGAIALIGMIFKSQWFSSLGLLADGDSGRYAAGQLSQLKQMRFDILVSGFVKFLFIAGLSLAAIYLAIKGTIPPTAGLVALVLITCGDLLTLNKKILRPQPRAAIQQEFAETETIRFLKSDSTKHRVFSLLEHAQSGDPNWTYFGIETIGGYSPTKMRIYQDIIEFALYKGNDPAFPINMNILNMLNVKYLIANGRLPEGKGFLMAKLDEASKTVVYENKGMLPRAFFTGKVIVEQDKARIFDHLNSAEFDPSRTVLLEKPTAFPVGQTDSSSIAITDFRSDRIGLDVYTEAPAQLVLSEVYYPHGWRAYVDGVETEIFKSNYVIRSISVPAGAHKVEFVFKPAEYTVGIWTSTMAFGGLLGLMIVSVVAINRRSKEAA